LAIESDKAGLNDLQELDKMEQLISSGQCDVSKLLPIFKNLSQKYTELEKQLMRLEKENKNLNVQLYDITRSLDLSSRIDPMTGLANRKDILEKIRREYTRTTRHHRTFSIIMLDVDDFQTINDRYGFNAGDDVLVEMARVLTGCVRNEDICARWSGEEFLVLLPETPVNGAVAVARKIRESVELTDFRTNKPGIHITVSLGISEHIPDQSLFECVLRADQALKLAKNSGKNQYCVAP